MIEPAVAAVRPRVTSPVTGDSVLLEDEVVDILESGSSGAIVLLGGPGSGKTTAVQHLAAVLPDDSPVTLVDDGMSYVPPHRHDPRIIICTGNKLSGGKRLVDLIVLPWGQDERIEYLLSAHPNCCMHVMPRTTDGEFLNGSPRWWRIILDLMARDPMLMDVHAAVERHLSVVLPTNSQREPARAWCLLAAWGLRDSGMAPPRGLKNLRKGDVDRETIRLIEHPSIRNLLGSEGLIDEFRLYREPPILEERLPRELMEAAGKLLAEDSDLLARLRRILTKPDQDDDSLARPRGNLLSLLRFADVAWRPRWIPDGMQLQRAYLDGVEWPGVLLKRTNLSEADLSRATLDRANLTRANLDFTNFSAAGLEGAKLAHAGGRETNFARSILRGANLKKASLVQADYTNAVLDQVTLVQASCVAANFCRASLRGARLGKAYLSSCQFEDTDLTDANLDGTRLDDVDLRTAILDGAVFRRAKMAHVNLEDVDWPDAKLTEAILIGAHLTGTRLHRADLRRADLRETGLGEVDWERADLRGADLRGASFHMGSSREGLLSSPYASEGTRTGFYSDEFAEQHFKSPEEIRKANLRGCDLRGANVDGVDFYLVDLRNARLDPGQRAHVENSGAIL